VVGSLNSQQVVLKPTIIGRKSRDLAGWGDRVGSKWSGTSPGQISPQHYQQAHMNFRRGVPIDGQPSNRKTIHLTIVHEGREKEQERARSAKAIGGFRLALDATQGSRMQF